MKQKIKMAIAVAVASFCCIPTFPQKTVEEKKQEINAIKKSSDYIYAEATMAEQQAAIDLAKEILYQNVNAWVAKQKEFAGTNNVVTTNMNYSVEDMTLPRGNWFRAFMYVKKTDIIPASNITIMRIIQKETQAENESEEQSAEKPAVIDEGLKTQLLACTNTGQLSILLKKLKSEGKVSDYQKLSSITLPNDYFIAIFSKDGVIQAILSDGAERINLKTAMPDKIANYKGNGAIGIKIKK